MSPPVDSRSGYSTTTQVKPGLLHSAILVGFSLALTGVFPLFFISAIFAAISAFQAYKGNQFMNRGRSASAEDRASAARKLRIATYVSFLIIGVLGVLMFVIGLALLFGPGVQY